jgi:Domain of Unknown Function with PDB structure (DUF3858)
VKSWIAILCFATMSSCVAAQAPPETSADLLFVKSDLTGALRKSAAELKHSPHDVNAHFVHMEAARLELRNREVLHSAIAVLQETRGEDLRAKIAAERLRELAANTPQFRAVLPQIAELLRDGSPYAVELSDAVMTAGADGTALPARIQLARRITKWQIAGPFGQFTNVDFDRAWPPEENELRSARYEHQVREDVDVESGELELPEYFSRPGIYYAASQVSITKAAAYTLVLETDGTYELRIDGARVLVHDARFVPQSATTSIEVQMAAGKHRIVVKLQASALPLRIWIEPHRESRLALPLKVPASEADYLKAAAVGMNGDPRLALALHDQSSVVTVLKAEALAQGGNEQQARELFLAASASDARNLLAAFKVAGGAFNGEQYEEAARQLAKVLKSAPAYPQAQELKFQLAEHFNWQTEQEDSLRQRLRLHPSCSALTDAAKFYDGNSQSDRARHYEAGLATCSPKPYQLWEQLSLRGAHELAGNSISKYLAGQPSDRHALTFAIREAVLSTDLLAASRYAKTLRTLAPNWSWATLLAERPELILDSRTAYSAANGFYKPFVRNPLPAMRDSEAQLPDSRVLINDRVVKLDTAGAWVYQHTVSQVLNKRGIAQLGEIDVPRAVDLLELRTIKADGTFIEAESRENKNTVSMPSLAEGDAIEIAYLQHINSEILAASPEVLDFAFTSSQSPTRSARLTLIRDHTPEPILWRSPSVRCIHSEPTDDVSTTTWEITNLPAIQDEPAAPQYDRRPRVLWLGIDRAQPIDPGGKVRDELIAATKEGFRIQELASELQSASEGKLTAAYRYVMDNIEDERESWRSASITSADESLQQGEGSRAATLIALLSAMGYEADLVLASERGKHDPNDTCPNARCYTHPLVRVVMPDSGQILLDPEIDGVASGALSPEVEGETAIVISRLHTAVKQSVVIPGSTDQRSEATATLQLDDAGGLEGRIQIRFGSFRSAQMRQMLRTISTKDREGFFEQIADRILPTANEVSATVSHEDDTEQALELELNVRAAKFARWNGLELQLEQMVPALGLCRVYATLPERQQPVLLDAPLVETSEFLINLPAGLEAVRTPSAVDLKSEFGEYDREVRTEGTMLKLTRRFRIPAQVIPPASYHDFSDFALQVDSAERQLIHLRRTVLVQMLPGSAEIPHPTQPLH